MVLINSNQNNLNHLKEKIIGFSFEVSNVLSCVLLENFYENALVQELKRAGLSVQAQYPISFYYKETSGG